MTAARLKEAPELLVCEPGRQGRSELSADGAADHTASVRQWVALASRLAASGWLSRSSPMIWVGVGR
jgi:hypothetical protein